MLHLQVISPAERADEVLSLHRTRRGVVHLVHLPGAAIDPAGDEADAVVWQELLARTGEESRLNVTFLAFLVVACVLAAIGVVTDSPVTIVGAMVLGPEFGPLAALAVGLVRRRWDLVKRGSRSPW